MSTLVSDIRYGFRQLWKNPGFTLVMVLVLSLGISVSIAIFSFVDWRLHPPSLFSDPKRIVHISAGSETTKEEDLPYLDCLALREQLTSLRGLATVSYEEAVLKKDLWSWKYGMARVSRDFFTVAGVGAHLGRVFSENDSTELRNQPGVVLSHRLWKSQFGSDPTILGRSILLDDVNRTVWGIAPPDLHSVSSRFEHGPVVDVWIPVEAQDEQENCTSQELVGRLKPGASIQILRVETEAAFQRFKLRNPNTLAPLRPIVLSDDEYRSAGGYPAVAFFLVGIGCAILLVACLNVSGSLLAKADTRGAEMAVRQALGGSRAQLIRQLLTEGALLAVLALGFSLLVSYWFMGLLRLCLGIDAEHFCSNYRLNHRVALFSFSVTLAGTLLFELMPIWYTCRANPIVALAADRSHHSRGGGRRYGFSLLVVFQLATALVLMVCTGLLLRSYLNASAIDWGFPPRDVLLARLQPSGGADRGRILYQDVVAQVHALSGVRSAGLGLWTPTDGRRDGRSYHVSLPGGNVAGDGRRATIQANLVDPGYFPTVGIPILRGHNFSEQLGPRDSRTVIVNEAFASRFWPDQDPVGRFVQLVDTDQEQAAPEIAQVVGLVRDLKKPALNETPEPYLYVPLEQAAFSDEMTLLVETQGDPHLLADPIRDILQRLDQRMPVYRMTTLSEERQNLAGGHATDVRFIGTLSLIGMALACIGLHGIVAFTVSRRTQELGIRMALGARSEDIMRTVMGQGLKLSLIGLGTGLMGSYVLSRVLWATLFGAGSFDPITFAGSSMALIGAALLACYFPARRAARIDPMVALRCE